ncbi:hypothetical protein J437_LFUL015738 [Ladona fulva]|uniref:Uncharacterized protein n=1 Tax=Ladona fulva TaxID=123851 RepID=A0A8K0P9F7_LADFU|nr:hypothetical protein J437_LFUL015738 [Ladona fulva]
MLGIKRLLGMIGGKLEKGVKVCLLKGPTNQYVAVKMHGISQATMSRVANKVHLALGELRKDIVKFPSSIEELMKAMAAFYKN